MKTILLVERHPDIQLLIRIIIQNHFDVQITMCESDDAAIEILTESQIDLIILSCLSLPPEEKFKTFRSFLKSSAPTIPFIIFTNFMSANREFRELIENIKKLHLFHDKKSEKKSPQDDDEMDMLFG